MSRHLLQYQIVVTQESYCQQLYQAMILPFLAIFLLLRLDFCQAVSPQLTKYLLSETFEGTWKLLEAGKDQRVAPWDEVEEPEGRALIYFTKQYQQQNQIETVSFELLMPKYSDGKVLKLTLDIRNHFNHNNTAWSGTINSSYFLFNSSTQVAQGTIALDFELDESLAGIKITKQLFIVVSFAPKYMNPLTPLFFALAALMVFLTVRRKTKVSQTHIKHQIIPLVLPTVMTFLISVCQIAIGFGSLFGKMSPETFFTVAGVINLAVCYQVAKFYWSVLFRNRWFIILVWIVSCAYIWFLLFFRHNYICLIFNSLILLPEIIYHCLRGRKIQPDFRFIFFVFSNQIYVMYFKSCPSNIFKESPSYLLAYCITSLLVTQTLILIGQIYVGSRFFIPAVLLPSYYNYYDQKSLKTATTKSANLECHICLELIKQQGKNRGVMITPCKHVFHSDCLQKWMVVQMKCPVDRSDLPPI